MSEPVQAGLCPLVYGREGQGRRPAMEDFSVFEVLSTNPLSIVGGIFDGHLGASVAKRAVGSLIDLVKAHLATAPAPEVALSQTMKALQEESARIAQIAGGGACAVIFHVGDRAFGEGLIRQITTANVGDAEAVYVPDNATEVDFLTTAHRLDNPDEIGRVYQTGAWIKKPYYFESIRGPQGEHPGNGLMPTRALGDAFLDKWGLSHDANIGLLFDVEGAYNRMRRPGYLVVACDGFWDVVQADELPGLIPAGADAQHVADTLFDFAMDIRQTRDNLSIIVVRVD